LNLISAAYFIANSDFAGVAICMHEGISDTSCLVLPATKTRKMHTSRRDAFRPVNATAIARVNYEEGKIEFLAKDYGNVSVKSGNNSGKEKLQLRLFNEKLKVAIIKTHTNMYAGQFASYRGYDGLVLEGTGLGHIPNEQIDDFTAENRKIQEAVAELVRSGTVVVMAPQTIYGRIQMKVYTPQRELMGIGVLGHLSDMTPETTFIKLAWLLSNYSREEAGVMIAKSLRGEIADRTEEETFLI
ncbi:asparaginase, partial [Candidatus Woesearchaeota archaeon]|nr:asparaginase [Candidatus Woesearchaeota archaeon]